jgi:hypothetical protein
VRVVLVSLCCFAETEFIRRVAKFPNPDAPAVPGSGRRNWVLGAVAYLACWVLWILGIFLGYQVLYSYYRRWRLCEYLKLSTFLPCHSTTSVAVASTFAFCILRNKIVTNLKIFEEIAKA